MSFFALVFILSVHHYHPFAAKSKLNRLILNDLSIMHCITIRVLLYEWLFSRECDLREDNKFVQIKTLGKCMSDVFSVVYRTKMLS